MLRCDHRLATFVLLCAAALLPAQAASSASSASSEGSSASVGSLSASLETSSDSSTGKDKKVADGDYRVVEVAAAPARPGLVRVRLQAVGAGDGAQDFHLVMPLEAAERGGVAAGRVVTARGHEYGLEFAAGQPQAAFFLVLHDAWYQELQTRAVSL